MALSGCLTCVKYTLFVFNFFFWLVGCLLLAAGIYALVEPKTFSEYTAGREWEASILVYSMITIGSVMTITGFLGCSGAIRESYCLIIAFFIFLFVINAVFVSAGMYLMITGRRDKVSEWFPRPEKEKIRQDLMEKINQIDSDPAMKTSMELIHSKYKCCGIDKGRQDYDKLRPDYRPSCNNVERNADGALIGPKIYSRLCAEAKFGAETRQYKFRMKKLTKIVIIISAVILGISSFMVVGLVLSIVMCCALKNKLVEAY